MRKNEDQNTTMRRKLWSRFAPPKRRGFGTPGQKLRLLGVRLDETSSMTCRPLRSRRSLPGGSVLAPFRAVAGPASNGSGRIRRRGAAARPALRRGTTAGASLERGPGRDDDDLKRKGIIS